MTAKTAKYQLGFPIDDIGEEWEFVLVRARPQKTSVCRWLAQSKKHNSIIQFSPESGAARAQRAAKAHHLRVEGYEFCHVAEQQSGMPSGWGDHESDGAACTLALANGGLEASETNPIVLISCECSFGDGDISFRETILHEVTFHEDEAMRRKSLMQKWQAAVGGVASGHHIIALVLLKADAQRLKETHKVDFTELTDSIFRELAASDKARPALVSVDAGQMQFLAQALDVPTGHFAPASSVSGTAGELESNKGGEKKPRNRKLWFALAACASLLSIGGALALDRLYVRPPCLPMDKLCLFREVPQFSPPEVGILIEQVPRMPDVDLRTAVTALSYDAQHWRENFRQCLASNYPASDTSLPALRIVAVKEVTPELLSRASALLGVTGQLTIDNIKNDYVFRHAEIFLNTYALNSNYAGMEKLSLTISRPNNTENCIGALPTFRGTSTIYPQTINSIFGTPASAQSAKQKPFHFYYEPNVSEIEIPLPDGRRKTLYPQNLNYMLHPELSYLETPEPIRHPIKLMPSRDLPMDELKNYIVSLLRGREWLDSRMPYGLGSREHKEIQFDGEIIWAQQEDGILALAPEIPMMQSLFLRLNADLKLLSRSGDMNECLGRKNHKGANSEKIKSLFESDEWLYNIHNQYAKAAKLDDTGCSACYLAMAQLMYLTNNDAQVMKDLNNAIIASTQNIDKARFLHIAAQFIASNMRPPPDRVMAQQMLEFLKQLSELDFDAIVNFEKARFLMIWPMFRDMVGGSVESLLRKVLQQRPSHALSRFLLARQLRIDNNLFPPGDEEIAILEQLLTDLLKANGAYSAALHSLGIGDDVNHSINITYVLEDLLVAQMARCNSEPVIKALRQAQYCKMVDWSRIERVIRDNEYIQSSYMFPGQTFFWFRPIAHFPARIACSAQEEQIRLNALRLVSSFTH